jgi:hypothetical protein
MSEAHNEFDNNLIVSNRSRDRRDFRISGDLVDEVLAVETADFLAANATGHDRNAMHVGLWNHRFHGGLNVPISKLSCYVTIEEFTDIRRLRGFAPRRRHF